MTPTLNGVGVIMNAAEGVEMKIICVAPISAVRVITDEPEFNEYTRYGPSSWYVRMGESEEPVYESMKLEVTYQEYVTSQNNRSC
jgi:hypothetical protein